MRKAHLMESIQPWIEKFIEQAQQQRSQSTKDYPTSYRNLRVKVSFGYGNFTSIPWFAFLGEGQEVSNGIYPVILYYKDFDELVLAYGISDTINHMHNGTFLLTYLKQSQSISRQLRVYILKSTDSPITPVPKKSHRVLIIPGLPPCWTT